MDQKDKEKIEAASDEVARQVRELISRSDLDRLKHLQLLVWMINCMRREKVKRKLLCKELKKKMKKKKLGRLQDSNAVLSHLNDFSERSYSAVANDFARNTRLIKSMKEDLDYIFFRIRALKARLASQYPNAFNEANKGETVDGRPDLEEPMNDNKQ
ncbi:hypothetical protein KP509_23G022800 [Ceratopteris richardii]|uniref:KxDL domain-containing protein n=1 Tax=Ceratopteris richardii TaxID=49495 RepID=A0A8T2S0C9_CERRI|nr:hypothetical protein KP509_23G022800 [Ceratopteris richardii]